MGSVLHDPGNPDDPTLLARIQDWYVKGETMSRLALHIHGDDTAWAKRDELVEAVGRLQDAASPLTLDELRTAVAEVGQSFGLTAYASEVKCAFDPLETVVDTSFYRAKRGGEGSG